MVEMFVTFFIVPLFTALGSWLIIGRLELVQWFWILFLIWLGINYLSITIQHAIVNSNKRK